MDLEGILHGWSEKLSSVLAKGYEGLRASGNAFWAGTNHWREFCGYEQEMDRFPRSEQLLSSH